jgi:hypothetical protein
MRRTSGVPVWQRNYYEHIIRNNEDYLAQSNYILDNPPNWEKDDENQQRENTSMVVGARRRIPWI